MCLKCVQLSTNQALDAFRITLGSLGYEKEMKLPFLPRFRQTNSLNLREERQTDPFRYFERYWRHQRRTQRRWAIMLGRKDLLRSLLLYPSHFAYLIGILSLSTLGDPAWNFLRQCMKSEIGLLYQIDDKWKAGIASIYQKFTSCESAISLRRFISVYHAIGICRLIQPQRRPFPIGQQFIFLQTSGLGQR